MKKCTIDETWENSREEFNNWVKNLQKKFDRFSNLRGWEVSKKLASSITTM